MSYRSGGAVATGEPVERRGPGGYGGAATPEAKMTNRRQFLAAAAAVAAAPAAAHAEWPETASPKRKENRIGLASYSLWQFRNDNLKDLEKNLDLAAGWGFAGLEILQRQMDSEDNAYFEKLKHRALIRGLDLYGMATHQTFLTPDADKRKKNVQQTIHYIEQCYALGIPSMRVQTGTWGTSKDFD